MSKRLSAFLAQMQACVACGECEGVCPTWTLTGMETDGPRGRLQIALGLAQKRIAPKEAAKALSRCLLCGKCERACPCQIPLSAIFFAARFDLRPWLPVSPARRRFARSLLRWPKFQDFLQPALFWLRPFYERKAGKWPLARKPFKIKSSRAEKERVLLFSGCLARRVFPDIAKACALLIEKHGFAPLAPADLVCCARPLALQGDEKGLLKAARKNLAIMAKLDFKWLVSPCPGCIATILNLWSGLSGLSGAEKKQIAELRGKAIGISAFLIRYGKPATPEESQVLHRPCLMDDAEWQAARELFGDRAESDSCCGSPLLCLDPQYEGEADALDRLLHKRPASLSGRLAQKARGQTPKGSTTIAACPGCLLALRQSANAPAMHVAEAYLRGIAKK